MAGGGGDIPSAEGSALAASVEEAAPPWTSRRCAAASLEKELARKCALFASRCFLSAASAVVLRAIRALLAFVGGRSPRGAPTGEPVASRGGCWAIPPATPGGTKETSKQRGSFHPVMPVWVGIGRTRRRTDATCHLKRRPVPFQSWAPPSRMRCRATSAWKSSRSPYASAWENTTTATIWAFFGLGPRRASPATAFFEALAAGPDGCTIQVSVFANWMRR